MNDAFIYAPFELEIVLQVLASLDVIHEIDTPGCNNRDNMRMFAERLEGYRVMVFPSCFTSVVELNEVLEFQRSLRQGVVPSVGYAME